MLVSFSSVSAVMTPQGSFYRNSKAFIESKRIEAVDNPRLSVAPLLLPYGQDKFGVTHPLLQIKSILGVQFVTVDSGVTGFTWDHALTGN